MATNDVFHTDPEIMSGTTVFVGPRVPVQALFDYLAEGDTLDAFLQDFPTVKRHQALHILDLAQAGVLAAA